jgi:radical SAM protein with 4Fe4S-binding SPASM domain
MGKDQLKPYVYKVEGAVNFAFYDMLRGAFYQITPEGSIENIRKLLLEEGLIFETGGIVPDKIIRYDIGEVQKIIQVRTLQIRLSGGGEDNCWQRKKIKSLKKYMGDDILKNIISAFQYIPIKRIQVEASEDDTEKIEKIIKEFQFKELGLNVEKGIDEKKSAYYREICIKNNIDFLGTRRKKILELKVEISNFFYSKHYNPCLGHQIAVDTEGEIKYCLWSDEVLGNISVDDLKDMIIMGSFDKYWELSKLEINICKDCELRFTCDDCRVFALKESGQINAKPSYCMYNPYTGE